jgi:hypothetical protein
VIAVALAFTPFAHAGKAGKERKADGQMSSGTIETVDATAKTVTVKCEAGSKTFKVGDTTKIAAGSLADLKAGQEVTVKYTGTGVDLQALAIGPKGEHKGGKKKH